MQQNLLNNPGKIYYNVIQAHQSPLKKSYKVTQYIQSSLTTVIPMLLDDAIVAFQLYKQLIFLSYRVAQSLRTNHGC